MMKRMANWDEFLAELLRGVLEENIPTVKEETEMKLSSLRPVKIRHLVAKIQVTEKGSVRLNPPVLNDKMTDPVEERACLAATIPAIEEVVTISIDGDAEQVEQFRQDPLARSYFYTLMKTLGYDLYGGTGLNRGVFYGVKWANHPLTLADETISYLSLLFTPFAADRQGRTLFFDDLDVLVVSEEEFDKCGLVAGEGAILAWDDFGQVRFKVGAHSVGKGMAISFKTAKDMGLNVPETWLHYDVVVSTGDIKIAKVEPGAYRGAMGVTWTNVWTIKGQKVGLGFEFWQFLKKNKELLNYLETSIKESRLPSYQEMILGMERAKALAAATNGEKYEPTELVSSLQEALVVLGPEYPWVNERLRLTVANYLLSQPWPTTEYRLVVVVHDWVGAGYYYSEENASVLAGKYPITAGLMKLAGKGKVGKFFVLKKSTASKFNIDSDGDAMFTVSGTLAKYALGNNLVKEPRDINVEGRKKHTLPLTLKNMAHLAYHIFESSALIGRLTLDYYRLEVAYDAGLVDVHPSIYAPTIEAVIKTAKWDMDLSILRNLDAKLASDLREIVPMPYLRAAKALLKKEMNESGDATALLQQRVLEPLSYMDVYWNAVLDRVELEIGKLADIMKAPADFAFKVGLVDLEEEDMEVLENEVEQLNALLRMYNPKHGLRDETRTMFLNILNAVGSRASVAALRVITARYLQGRHEGTGSFVIHLCKGRLAEVFDESVVYKMEKPEQAVKLVRVFSTELEQPLTPTELDALKLEDGVPYMGEAIFEIGDEAGLNDLSAYKLISVLPYVNRKGQYTKSCYLVVESVA